MSIRLVPVVVVFVIGCAASTDAAAQTYVGTFSGTNESPPNLSAGMGSLVLDYSEPFLSIDLGFSGLTGTTTAAHIHCCVPPGTNAAVATQVPSFSGFPVGVSAGTYVQFFDLTLASSFNPSFVTNNGGTVDSARAALLAGMNSGQAYFNVHTQVFPGGEIRANLQPLVIFADGFEGG